MDDQIEDNGSTPENNDQDPVMQDEQVSKASQDDNYHTAIDDDDLDDTSLATQSFNHFCQEASEYPLQR